MKIIKQTILLTCLFTLSACTLTPEQKAQREAKGLRTEQALQVKLAKQCDLDTADLIAEQHNPPLNRSEKEQKAFEQRYTEKINNPVFQACYKLALQNYKAQEELQYMRMRYYDDDFFFRRFCYACW